MSEGVLEGAGERGGEWLSFHVSLYLKNVCGEALTVFVRIWLVVSTLVAAAYAAALMASVANAVENFIAVKRTSVGLYGG